MLGKTGTAEVKKHHKRETTSSDLERWNPNAAHAWFAGWAPADDPEIAIVVLVEHGGAGGRVAWPIAKQILEGYFTKIHPSVAAAARHAGRRRPGADADEGHSASSCRARPSACRAGAGSAPRSTGR